MSRYIPDIRSFVPFVILYADVITNFTNVPNATNFNRLFSGKPLMPLNHIRCYPHPCKGNQNIIHRSIHIVQVLFPSSQ
ncbi:MAG: hypothetical protein EF813_00970 [Methanosarcinales archaeon]|nr:MAG: hypothetical protein EF813_00970 [Methanosarcinales archaeon]